MLNKCIRECEYVGIVYSVTVNWDLMLNFYECWTLDVEGDFATQA